MSRVLGIDIGGTFTRYGIVENKSVIHVKKVYTKDILDFPNFVKDVFYKFKDIDSISIGIPGVVYKNKIISVPNVKLLEIRNLDDEIYKLTKTKCIINRDVYLLFSNDINRLNLSNEKNILGFYLGTGLGNAIKMNGNIIKGEHGYAAELGHIPIIGNTRRCSCGKIGCAETMISGKALTEIYDSEKLNCEFNQLFVKYSLHPKIKEFIDNFIMVMAIEINILDITTIIIGGGVTNMLNFPKKYIEEGLLKQLRTDNIRKQIKIYFVDDSPISSILGASLIINEGETNEYSNRL